MHMMIVETGAPAPPLKASFGRYGAMFQKLLAPAGDGFRFSTASIHDGGAMPSVGDFDALLVTGSAAGVYEGHDWIAPAENLIRETAKAGKPQAGICFGHQLMAQAFGGKVEKSEKGWGVGVHEYAVKSPLAWMTPTQATIRCALSHQDQVINAPTGARILAGSDFCPNGALSYAQGPAVSFQMHPEFDHDFARALLQSRKNSIAPERVEQGMASLDESDTDRRLLGRWLIQFFNQNRRA